MRFLLLDSITEWQPGLRAVGIKNIALSEDFFEDHFPLCPIMPGSLILEGMAQLAGLMLEEGVRRESGQHAKALMTLIEKAKFRQPAMPGDTLRYTAMVSGINEMGGKADVQAHRGDELMAQASLVFAFKEVDHAWLDSRRDEILSYWLKGVEPDAER